MTERKDKRIEKKFIVSFNKEESDELGVTRNLSRSGVCIDSETIPSMRKEVAIDIAVPGEIFHLKGEVIWCKEPEDKNDTVPDSIGIKITEAPVEYLNFVEYIRHQGIEPGKPEF